MIENWVLCKLHNQKLAFIGIAIVPLRHIELETLVADVAHDSFYSETNFWPIHDMRKSLSRNTNGKHDWRIYHSIWARTDNWPIDIHSHRCDDNDTKIFIFGLFRYWREEDRRRSFIWLNVRWYWFRAVMLIRINWNNQYFTRDLVLCRRQCNCVARAHTIRSKWKWIVFDSEFC